MHHANPPKRPVGRPKSSSTQVIPVSHPCGSTSSTLNTNLPDNIVANSITNSNETTNHFLGAGALQRPWMRPGATIPQPFRATLTSASQARTSATRYSTGTVPALTTPTNPPASTTNVNHAQPSTTRETQISPTHLVSSAILAPAGALEAAQNADGGRQRNISNSNIMTNGCDHALQERSKANEVDILDLTLTEDCQPTEPVTVPILSPVSQPRPLSRSQVTTFIDLPVLDMQDDFHLVARHDPTPSTDLDAWRLPDSVQDTARPNSARSFANITTSRSIMSLPTSTRSNPTRISFDNASTHPDSMPPPQVTPRTDSVSNQLPQVATLATSPRRVSSSPTTTPTEQALASTTRSQLLSAQLLTPEPSPLSHPPPLSLSRNQAPELESLHCMRLPLVSQSASILQDQDSSSISQRGPHPRPVLMRPMPDSAPANIVTRQPSVSNVHYRVSANNRGLSYLTTFDGIIGDMSRRVDLNNFHWNMLRMPWLRDACQRNDLFFLHLNQLFCMWSMNAGTVRFLGIEQNCDSGFAVLELLFGKNTDLPRELLAFLAGWPNSTYSLEINEQLKQWTSEISRFLPILGSNWPIIRGRCLARRVPPMVSEIVHHLGCPTSIILPQAIFCSLQQQISPAASEHLQTAVFTLFTSNVKAVFHGQLGSAEFPRFQAAYQAICAQHLKTPGSSQTQECEIRSILSQHNSSGSLMQSAVPSRNTQGSGRSPQMQTWSDARPPNEAVPTMAVVGRGTIRAPAISSFHPSPNPSIQPPSRNMSMIQASVPCASVQRNQQGVVEVIQQSPNGLGPIQSDYIRTNNLYAHLHHPTPIVPSNVDTRRGSLSLPASSRQSHNSFLSTHQWLLPTDRCHLPDIIVNPDPVQEGLHQAHLQQPLTELKDYSPGSCQRLYQFIEAFALEPYQWLPASGFMSITFDVPEELLKRRAQITEQFKGPFEISKRVIGVGSTLLNLRCVKLGDNQDMARISSSWPALPTTWPQHIFISINNRHLEIRRKRHNRRDLPIDVTPFVTHGKNEIKISIHPEVSERDIKHGIAIEVIGFCDHQQALAKPIKINAETSLKAITSVMEPQHDPNDDDIVLMDDKIIISVTDPFSSRIITTPVRGNMCKHRECFDLETFLESRRSDQKDVITNVYAWQCPICKVDARPHSLMVDGFFQDVCNRILEQGQNEARAIVVTADGTWHVKETFEGDDLTARGSSRNGNRSSRLSSASVAAKVTHRESDIVAEHANIGQENIVMADCAIATNLPPQNSRIAEVIELD